MSRRNRKSCVSPVRSAAFAAVENLEERRLMAADAVLVGNLLEVTGTESADTILVENTFQSQSYTTATGMTGFMIVPKVHARISNASGTIDRYFNPSSVSAINVFALGGNDAVTNNTALGMYADAGAGSDAVNGGSAGDSVYGQAGHDTLSGNNGNDLMLGGDDNDVLDGGLGADCLFGNAGTDTATYSARTADLKISLDDAANDGQAGEADNVDNDIERVNGGSGDDLIVASSGATDNLFHGNAGNDTLKGNGGNDKLYGDIGNDNLHAGAGNDSLYGEEGVDTLVSIGGGQSDQLSGGSSTDFFWCDSEGTETVTDASTTENDNGHVHRVGSFAKHRIVNDSGTASEFTVSRELTGQDLQDPDATRNGSTPAYAGFSTKPLFSTSGPQDTDIDQNGLGDCYFLAALSATADADPTRIRNAVVDLGDGTFAVRFKAWWGDTYVRVDHELPVNSSGNPQYAGLGAQDSMWVAVMEKAWAFYRHNEGRYDSIEGGWPADVFAVLGASSDVYYRNWAWLQSESEILNHISSQLSAGKAVTLCTRDDTPSDNPIVGNHCYMIESVSVSNGTVTLRNPWDASVTTTVSAADFREAFSQIVSGNM